MNVYKCNEKKKKAKLKNDKLSEGIWKRGEVLSKWSPHSIFEFCEYYTISLGYLGIKI